MFVRGLANITNISRIQDNIGATPLGIVYPELRTKDDTLSMWYIENMEDFMDAALSIVLPRGKIDKAVFLIIDDAVLAECGVNYKFNPADRIYVEESRATHCDMINVHVDNIQNVLAVYRTIYLKELESEAENRIVQWTTDETKQYIYQAVQQGKVKLASLHSDIQKKLQP
ncbi:MAG: hypothetical protein ACI4CT_08025 [Lachnospiraceae bacterium]